MLEGPNLRLVWFSQGIWTKMNSPPDLPDLADLPDLTDLPDLPEVVPATAARSLPSTRAGGQDDGS